MEVATAQQEVREVYLGGSVGQAVSGVQWLLSAALGTLLLADLALGRHIQGPFAVGAWITGFLLLGLAAAGRMHVASRPPAGG